VRLTGLGVSPGIAIGRALILKQRALEVRFRVAPQAVAREIDRLERARQQARRQLEEIKAHIERVAGPSHAYVFDAQLLMLDDPMLAAKAEDVIRTERVNAEWAVRRACDDLAALFDEAEAPHLRERHGDVADVAGRLCMNLRGGADRPADLFNELEGPLVVVADELSPSVAAQMDWDRVAGFVTDAGSWTYHTAILARSLHVPAVVGLRTGTASVAPGATVALDGATGEVLVDPSPQLLQQVEARRERRDAFERSLGEYRRLPAVTRDGVGIRLEANVELPDEVEGAREHGAEGIGLYRSEFLLAAGAAGDALTEEAQYRVYRTMVERMAPGRVTIRTFDAGEEQFGGESAAADASRGRLGLRGIRLSLERRDLFRTQLSALLRAAAHGPLRIMFPFVAGVDEVRAARAVLAEAAAGLRARGLEAPAVPVGVMIEVPSAALTADLLAREADFFSVGTNDLIQYCLAVDRTDERVLHLYEPLHPALLRTLRLIERAARRRGTPLSLCGEMAADPALLALLIGLGIRDFSMTPSAIPLSKQIIRNLRVDDARQVARRALRCATAADVEREMVEYLASPRNGAAVNE
jgi:phosphotransferase system enzyme I (PtsI)